MQKEDININCGYDNNGAFLKFDVHIPYSELKTFNLPKSCTCCPCGYMKYGCGRNYPFEDEDYDRRPSMCKLDLISVEDIIKIISELKQ